jgi:hypothetical protein
MIFKNGLQEWSIASRIKPGIAQGCAVGSGGLGFFAGWSCGEATFSRKGLASPEFGINVNSELMEGRRHFRYQ